MRTWVGTGMRGIVRALAGGVIIGAIPCSVFARGWGDSTEGRLLVQVFKASDYQSNSRVSAAAQDRDGVLYFASDGLLQYDGSAWRHFPTANNRGANGLAIDDHGRIWVGGFRLVGYLEKDPSGQL